VTHELLQTELQEPESGRWVRVDLTLDQDRIARGVAETSSLPLLEETVRAVLDACRGRRRADVIDLTPGQLHEALSDARLRDDDVAFALRAVQQALLERTH